MLIDPIYFIILHDVAKPKTYLHSMHWRTDRKQWANIRDNVIEKVVLFGDKKYKILNSSTFHIANSVDNNYYAVCDAEEIKD